jgi:hypothetical protein
LAAKKEEEEEEEEEVKPKRRCARFRLCVLLIEVY